MRLSELGAGWRAFDRDLRRSLRALIVADDPEARELLAERVQLCGVRAEGCSTAEKALERLCEQPFDLLLAHEDLPGIDGIELVARARALRIDVPAIVLAKGPGAATVAAALRAGADDCLSRPLDLGLLRARLDAVLDVRLAALTHDRVISDLQRLVDLGSDRARLLTVGRELQSFKRALLRRPPLAIVAPQGDEREPLALEELVAVGLTPAELLRDAADPARSPLVVIVPLALPGAAGIIRELRTIEPLLEVLVRVEDAAIDAALSVLSAGAADLVLASEGPAVLAARAARLVRRARRRWLHLHLLATLWRAARTLGEAAAEPLGRLVPPGVRESLDRYADDAPLLESVEIDVSDLLGRWESIDVDLSEP